MDVRTIVEQLQADAGGELSRERLSLESAALNALRLLTEKEGEGVFSLANLTLEVGGLRLYRVVISLCTLYGSLLYASQLLLNLHDFPCLLGELGHVIDHLQLLVEHQESVVHIGNIGYYLSLYHLLIVSCSKESHLCRALLIEKVAEEVDAP